jgi:hypothetical protein
MPLCTNELACCFLCDCVSFTQYKRLFVWQVMQQHLYFLQVCCGRPLLACHLYNTCKEFCK